MTTYAIADQVPEGCDYLTAGKKYEVLEADKSGFLIADDTGYSLECLWDSCFHLNGGNWRRVEK